MTTFALQHALQALNFTEKEAKTYLALLELHEALPSVISKKVGLKRPTTYMALEKLLERGLVTCIKKQKVLYYQAIKPEIFLEKEQKRIEESKANLSTLTEALPKLYATHEDYTKTPQMSVYHGREGVIQVMEDSLTTKGEILCWSNVEIAKNTFLTNYHPTYLKKKISKKIHSKCLFDKGAYAQELKRKSKQQLREVRFIPDSEYKFENEINIYDDKVSIISPRDEIGVIIQNKAIADSQRALFYMAFEKAGN